MIQARRPRWFVFALIALIASLLPLGLPPTTASADQTASPWDPVPLQPFKLIDAHQAPEVRILLLGTGLSLSAIPQGMEAKWMEGWGPDAVGWGTAAATVMSSVYPATSINIDSVHVNWTRDGCMSENYGGTIGSHVYDALSGRGTWHGALRGITPQGLAQNYDAVLLAIPPHCIPSTSEWALTRSTSLYGGQIDNDATLHDVATRPIDPSYTEDPSGGPAIGFDSNNKYSGFVPAGWGGKTGPKNPYHDAGSDLRKLTASGYWNYYDRIVAILDSIKAAGLPVIIPSGDLGASNIRPDKRNWQSIRGLAALDSVITVGGAATTGNPDDPDRGWLLAPSTSAGITSGGINKPDLLGPGFATFVVGKDSDVWRRMCQGSRVCNPSVDSMKSVLPYVEKKPGDGGAVTGILGFGASDISAAIVTVLAAQAKKRWPGGWQNNAQSVDALLSLLQAKATRLEEPQASTGLPPAPYEQGAGVLTTFPDDEDVLKTPLLAGRLDLPISNVKCPSSGTPTECPTPSQIEFLDGTGTPLNATHETTHMIAADLLGFPRNVAYERSGDPEPLGYSIDCDIGPPCELVPKVESAVRYAAVDCGWVTVSPEDVDYSAEIPYCSIRALTVDLYLYFPWDRPLEGNIVSFDVYNPSYVYLTSPLSIRPEVDSTIGALVPSNIPPYITLYTDETDEEGWARFENVVPGIYSYRPHGGYKLPSIMGVERQESGQCDDCYFEDELGGLINFQHAPPLVVPSPLNCDELPEAPWALVEGDHLMPACRPSESDWYPTEMTFPTPDSDTPVTFTSRDDPNREVLHEPDWFDDVTGVCLYPIEEYLEGPGYKWLKRWSIEVPYFYNSIAFICGEGDAISPNQIRTRFGTGVASHRVRTLRTGIYEPDAGGSFVYQGQVGGATKTYSDFKLWECGIDLPIRSDGTVSSVTKNLMGLADVCEANPNPVWNWGKCPECSLNERDNRGDYTRFIASADMAVDPPTSSQLDELLGTNYNVTIPVGIAQTKLGLLTPNYETHVEFSLDVDVHNAVLVIAATAGDATKYALAASASPAAVTATTGGFRDPDWDDCDLVGWDGVSTFGCKGRRTATWDFRSLGANTLRIDFIILPAAVEEDAWVDLKDIEVVIETLDKVPFERGPRDPVIPNEFVIAMNPHLYESDLAHFGNPATAGEPAWPFCNGAGVCDDYRVVFGTPKGPQWREKEEKKLPSGESQLVTNTHIDDTCQKDDVYWGAGSLEPDFTKRDPRITNSLPVSAWDPDPDTDGLTPIRRAGFPARVLQGPNNLPLISGDPYHVNNHFIGVVDIPFGSLHENPGQFQAVFGPYGGPCPPPPPDDYPEMTAAACPSHTAYPIEGVSIEPKPSAPYSTRAPGYCGFYRTARSLMLEGFSDKFTYISQKLPDQDQHSFSYKIHATGALWDQWFVKGMRAI